MTVLSKICPYKGQNNPNVWAIVTALVESEHMTQLHRMLMSIQIVLFYLVSDSHTGWDGRSEARLVLCPLCECHRYTIHPLKLSIIIFIGKSNPIRMICE